MSSSLRTLELYILVSIGLDFVKDIMMITNVRTLWLSQCFSIVELFLFSRIFYGWRTSTKNGLFIWASFFIYLSIWLFGKFTFEPIMYSDNYSYTFSQTIQIGFGGWLLLNVLRENNIVWKHDPRIWALSGIVGYSAATFFLFGMFNVMLTLPRRSMLLIWQANLIFIIVQYIFFLRAFLCKLAGADINPQPQTK